jgi:GWxTD domain-containing protein
MMKNRGLLFFILLSAGLFISSCFIPTPLANKDYAHLYTQKSLKIEPVYKVFHLTNTKSRLYLFTRSEKLLFAKPIDADSIQSRISVHYRLFSSSVSSALLDSATFLFTHNKPMRDIVFTDSITFLSNLGNEYALELIIRDLNRKEEFEDVLIIDKTKNSNEQFFLLKQKDNIIHNHYNVRPNEKISINFFDTSVSELNLKAFTHEFPIAIPPFSEMHELDYALKFDSLYSVKKSLNEGFTFSINKEGYYFIKTDTAQYKGFGFYSYNESFPGFASFEEMIGPLRYLTTRNEFETLMQSKDSKLSIDKFWLELSGNKERARELIKQYYSRVQNANYYFTSYKEGWKTDRGMIYIIFGSPNFVTRNGNIESWTYGEQNNYRSLNFFFTNQQKSMNSNDFKLERNPLFKDDWMQAIDVWRQGRVYNPYN